MSAFDEARSDFDGRMAPLATRPRRRRQEGHAGRCSSNPEVGCVCGLAERESERNERLHAPDARVAS